MNKELGYFDTKKREYVITNMHPRRPLKNYLWNEKVVAFYDQFGAGNATANTLTQLRPLAIENRMVYVKDKKTGDVYSPNRNFDYLPFEVFECHVGLGYHRIISKYNGLKVEMTIVIPGNDYAEMIHIKVKNESKEKKDISLYTYVKPHVNLTWHTPYSYADYNEDLSGLYFTHIGFNIKEKFNRVLIRASEKPFAYEVCDEKFKGFYNDLHNPIGISLDKLTSTPCTFDDHFSGALQFDVSLEPNEEKEINQVLVIGRSEEEINEISSKYYTNESYYEELKNQEQLNDKYIERYLINTPDAHINELVNYWLKRQISLGKTWGRVYGKGFRDVLQDTSSFTSLDPSFAKNRILNTLKYQFKNGNSIRQFDPIMDYPYQDGAAWIPATVLAYLKETNNASILEEKVPYYDSDISETVYEHMLRGLNYLINSRGSHNLVLWGGGDWNDSLNNCGMKGRGESVWLSIATVKAINDFVRICQKYKPQISLDNLLKEKENLVEAIKIHGFEGDRFIYGYNDVGDKIGSEEAKEGKIYLNPQTWAVLAEVVKDEEALKVMNTVEEKLKCDYGYVQVFPAYSKGTDDIGRASYFYPGNFENGSVYNHGVSFKIAADLKLGLKDRAYETLKMISYDNPKNLNNGMEPYAFSNMFLGPECKCRKGYAPQSWITGTAGWIYNDISELMIGIKPNFDGLLIEPCLPSSWNEVEVFRIYQDAKYDIKLIRSNKNEILFDNKKINGNNIPVVKDNEVHKVICYFK